MNVTTPLIEDIRNRVKCVRRAGGSVYDGSAKHGFYDFRSLEVMCDVGRDRARSLNCIEREFEDQPKSHMIHTDPIALELREERRTLLTLIEAAKAAIEHRIKYRKWKLCQ